VTAPGSGVPSVAGMPIVHEPSDAGGWSVPWPAGGASEPALHIAHRRGPATAEGGAVVMQMPPWATYFRAASGRTVVRFHDVTPGCPAQLVRPLDEIGERFEIVSEHAPPPGMERWDRDLAVVMLALAARRRGLIAHGCGFLLPDGGGVLCPAVSGTGKSTLARLLESSETGARVLNDDRLIVTDGPDGAHLWSTPWPGSNGRATPGDGPLHALVFRGRADAPTIRALSTTQALQRLARTVALPLWEPALVDWSLTLLDRVLGGVPVVEYAYPPTPAAARALVDALAARTLT
jgi:hypothetical protein